MFRFKALVLSCVPSLLALSACVVAPSDEEPGAVAHVTTIGAGRSADPLCKTGEFSVTLQPRNAVGEVVLPESLAVACGSAKAGAMGLNCGIQNVECTPGSQDTGQRTVALVILDDSGSMKSNDPDNLRRTACADFVASLDADDAVAITDYGPQPSEGSVDKGTKELRIIQDFTTDKNKAIAACQQAEAGGGTPLYEAVAEGVDQMLVEARAKYAGGHYSMLLLSDGKPSSSSDREVALEAAKRENIPIYTVGLGPAAEGKLRAGYSSCASDADCTSVGSACRTAPDATESVCHLPDFSQKAVQVLQELSNETLGAYASATNPEALEFLFKNVSSAVREGKCTVSARLDLGSALAIGERVVGTLAVGTGKAKSNYEFTVPLPEDPAATLCK